jgi:hypothetical protein
MYDCDKIDIFEFGAVSFVIEIIYCFEIINEKCDILLFEINLN